jgi:hypothetical protein
VVHLSAAPHRLVEPEQAVAIQSVRGAQRCPTLGRVAKREEHLQRPSQLLVGIVNNERKETILPGRTLAFRDPDVAFLQSGFRPHHR